MTDIVSSLRIGPLSRKYSRTHFDSGNPVLDEYLGNFAGQNDKKNIARTFVAIDGHDNIAGYYSLCTASIAFEDLPKDARKHLPEYPIPAALIAKLAVNSKFHGQGLGAKLLIDALQRVVTASQELAVKAVLVDAIDEAARDFYRHFGFIELPGQDLKLFLPIETVLQLFRTR